MDTDQLVLFFWNNISWIISVLVAIIIGLLTLYYQIREKSPNIIDTVEELDPYSQFPHEGFVTRTAGFHLSSESSQWVIYEVRSPEVYNNWLAVPGPDGVAINNTGAVLAYRPYSPWS